MKTPSPPASGSGIVQYMGLSLMILLLAFFIVLNAISDFEDDKINPRLESIDRKFAAKASGGERFPSRVAAQGASGGAGEAFDQIEDTLKSQGIPFEAQRLDGNAALSVSMPEERFLPLAGIKDGADSGEKNIFLGKIVMLTMPAGNAQGFHLHIRLPSGKNPAMLARTEPDFMSRRLDLADRIARRFILGGFDQDLVRVGLNEGRTGYIELHFEALPALQKTGATGGEPLP